MANEDTLQQHAANAIFMLLEDRQFRFDVIRPGLEKEKQRLGRLVTGKHQVRGFRNIAKAPVSMLLPVISEEANLSADLAFALLTHWYNANGGLKDKVGAELTKLGYKPESTPFDENNQARWNTMSKEHAQKQFDGEFLPDEDENSVMLMSLLLGWFGTDEEDEPEQEQQQSEPEKVKTKKAAAKKEEKPAEKKTAKKAAPEKKETATKKVASKKTSGAQVKGTEATPKTKKAAKSKTTKK